MAEGGAVNIYPDISRSIEDGSDIVFEFECTPCAADGSRVEALQFCQTCNEFLCDICTKYHQRFTKSHQLIPARSTKHQKPSTNELTVDLPKCHIHLDSDIEMYCSTNELTIDLPKCHIHLDRDIEMYCGAHDMVYCLLCITKEHRSCTNVVEIRDGVHKPNPSKHQQLVADIDRVNNELHEAKGEISRNIKTVKTKEVLPLKEIDKLRKEMKDHLDHLERKAKGELDEAITSLEQEMTSDDIKAADDLMKTTNERKAELAHKTNDKHMFITEKLCQNEVSAAHAFLARANQYNQEVLKFERNTRLYNYIKGSDHLGIIARNSSCFTPRITKCVKYVVKSSSKSNLKVETDGPSCTISGICQLQDGSILIADHINKKLKRLDYQLYVKDYCDLKSKPRGLCSISPTEVVVRYRGSIQFIHVGESLSPGKKVNIKKLGGASYGNAIAFCDNNLWTFSGHSLRIYTIAGKLVKTINKDPQGKTIFGYYSPESIAINDNESRAYVTTWKDRVVVFNKNGEVIQDIPDKRLRATCGVCITDDDIALVAGFNSGNVVMFDTAGESIGELFTEKELSSPPRVLCYDRMKCRLLVGCESSDMDIYELRGYLNKKK